jgi:pSer/pThr/pTyr-binding forkhead associated (FHA) protein
LPLKTSKTPAEIASSTWRIVLIPNDPKKAFIALEIFDNISIGRDDPGYLNLDLDLKDFDALNMGVSRQHAMIRVDRASLYLYDIGSTNGTYCNNKRAWLGNPVRLNNGDVIALAALEFKLKVIARPSQNPDR